MAPDYEALAQADLQTWAEAYAALEPGESEWSFLDYVRVWADRLRGLAADPANVELTEEQWDNLAARAAEDAQSVFWDPLDGMELPEEWVAKRALRDEVLSPEFKEALLDTLALLVIKVAANIPNESFGTGFFWDQICILARPIDISALPGIASQREPQSSRMFEALFEVLGNQLGMPDKQLQISALRGLMQLGHPKTGALIDSVRPQLVDEEVRWSADRASRFELL